MSEANQVIDDVIGEFGAYQRRVFWLLLVPASVMSGVQSFKQVLMSEAPPLRCRTRLPDTPTTTPLLPSCSDGNVSCQYGWQYDRTHFLSTVVTEWDLVCEYRIVPVVAQFVINFGGMVGSMLFGHVTDSCGRRPAFLACLTLSVTFDIMTSVAPHYVIWIIIRFFAGFSIPAIYQITFILSVELVGVDVRWWVGVVLTASYSLGLLVLCAVAYVIRHWRQMSAATSVVFLLLLLGGWKYVPESPRWLLAQGRLPQAVQLLNHIAGVNGRQPHLTQDMLAVTSSRGNQQRFSVLVLFATRNMRRKTVLLTCCWAVNMMVYCGLSLYAPSMGSNPYVCFALSSAVELPSHAAMIYVLQRCSRRLSLALLLAVGGASCVSVAATTPTDIFCMALFLIGKFAISATYLLVFTYGSELYPTEVRGLGLGLATNVGMFANSFIPFINYAGLFSFSLPLIVMGTLACVAAVLALALPETLNKPLPQTLDEGEQFGAEITCFTCRK